jgi:hypothetical protein
MELISNNLGSTLYKHLWTHVNYICNDFQTIVYRYYLDIADLLHFSNVSYRVLFIQKDKKEKKFFRHNANATFTTYFNNKH